MRVETQLKALFVERSKNEISELSEPYKKEIMEFAERYKKEHPDKKRYARRAG